jgi:hypothetical protein
MKVGSVTIEGLGPSRTVPTVTYPFISRTSISTLRHHRPRHEQIHSSAATVPCVSRGDVSLANTISGLVAMEDEHLEPPPRLFERLRQIVGYTWDESREPLHSSYDCW